MSRLAEIQRHIQETGVAIARAERALAAHPEFSASEATLRSFLKMRETLEVQFRYEAASLEFDVCSYRITPEGDRPTISGLTAVLAEFQRLLTTTYDALVNGPKLVAKVGDVIERATSLGLAYTFPGSIGVMMTLENKRLLFGESKSKLDDAMQGVFELMRVTTPTDVLAVSRKYGVAALRVVHQWAKANAEAQFGADIAWLRADQAMGRINLQRPEVVRLEAAIRHTTESSEEEMAGEITMVDWDSKSFRMKSEGRDISGPFDESVIDTLSPAKVPGFYLAKMRVARRILSDGDATPTYVLVDLVPLSDLGLGPTPPDPDAAF